MVHPGRQWFIPKSNYAIHSVFGTNVVNEVSNLNNDLDHEVVDLIDADEALKRGLELIETSNTESDICINWLIVKMFLKAHISPNPTLNLIRLILGILLIQSINSSIF